MIEIYEHFAWARTRALEYVDLNQPAAALNSLISDLNKHPGTAKFLYTELLRLAVAEYALDGNVGVRRFIEGLCEPAKEAIDE
jgi:hypothetical protein